ncbi:unnamed protein product [Musa textilis]
MHSLELFQIKPSKIIGDMYIHFTNIVNSLKALGKSFSNLELTNKILRSLSKSWDPKVIIIQETKDLNYFLIEELIGSLMIYKITCMIHDKYENNLPKNRKDLTLRTKEHHLSESSSNIELLTRKFKKFINQETKNKN